MVTVGIQQPGFLRGGQLGQPFRIELVGRKYATMREFADALNAAAMSSGNELAREMSQSMRRDAIRGYGRSGLQVRTGQMRGSIVSIFRRTGRSSWQFGAGSTVFYFEYHEHGTYGQRELPPGFKRQYRGPRRNPQANNVGVPPRLILRQALVDNVEVYAKKVKARYRKI